MAPIAYGILSLIGGAMVLAVLVGAAGGAIYGRLRGDLFLGAILVAVAYVLLFLLVESVSAWKITLFGMFPLMLSFLVGSLTGRFLDTRLGLRPLLAGPAAFFGALLVGFSYLLMHRFGWLTLNPATAWIALAMVLGLMILSIRKRMRTAG
jgi:hypothetical protein